MTSFSDIKSDHPVIFHLSTPQLRNVYANVNNDMQLVRQIISSRHDAQLSQQDLADLIGTKQSVISRLESGRANPSVALLQKLAEAFHLRLKIEFVQP